MAETPEIDELAKRYLDLWQEHLCDMAVDPEWSASITRLFAALPLLKGGSPNWKAALDEVILQVAEVDTLELTTAVERESRRRLATFLEDVQAYRNHPYRRRLPEPAVAARSHLAIRSVRPAHAYSRHCSTPCRSVT